jgi:hypothetical protein
MKDWREEVDCKNIYKKKYAFWPVTCMDGSRIWRVHYYRHYHFWVASYAADSGHTDYVGKISEAEYLIRKLSEVL